MFPTSNTGSRKYYLWKKYDWLKNWLFFITENFLGILDWLCMEPMRRSHDFLSLTQVIVGTTSSSCYFLLQCRCLWVVCFSSKVCEESSGWIRRDLKYFTITTPITYFWRLKKKLPWIFLGTSNTVIHKIEYATVYWSFSLDRIKYW